MTITATEIPEVLIIEPKIFEDQRGYFFESYNATKFPKQYEQVAFVQDNESKSSLGVLRGLHYQLAPYCQSKLIRVIQGSVLDVVVDVRKGSPTFGKHVMVTLTGENKRQLFVPRGFAHGFVVTSENTIFSYKCDNYYSHKHDRGVLYSDPDLGIDWGMEESQLILSDKDKNQPLLKDAVDLFDYKTNLYA